MNDQHTEGRILLTTVIILAIWLGWKALFPTPEPEPAAVLDAATEKAVPGSLAPFVPALSLQKNDAATDGANPTFSDGASDALSDENSAPLAKEKPFVEEFYAFSTKASDVLLSNKNATFTTWNLKDFTMRVGEELPENATSDEAKKEANKPVSMVPHEQLRLTLGEHIEMPKGYQLVSQNKEEIILRGETKQVAIELKYKHKDSYIMDIEAKITNRSKVTLPINPEISVEGFESLHESTFMAPAIDVLSLKCLVDKDLETKQAKKLEKDEEYRGNIRWVGADRQYFLAAVGPSPDAPLPYGTCRMHKKSAEAYAEISYVLDSQNVPAGATSAIAYRAFIGPKMQKSFDTANMALEESVDYVLWGIPLAFLAKPMLWLMGIFYDLTNSYGLAIILLTLVVKLILTPVNHKNMISMRAMQKLQPKIEEIKKRHANDQEAQTREMMKLYQEEHFNPLMTGCLPMLLQMPIYVALYRAIGSAVELYQQPFLWISDLSLKEPIPFLAIALGVMTFLQQKFMSASNNSQQNQQMKVMMYTMPVFLTLIMFALPSALVLYTLVNSILSILHQLYINKTYKAS